MMFCLRAIKESDLVPSAMFIDVLTKKCEFKKDFGQVDKVLSSVTR